jgi:hypothetical protein
VKYQEASQTASFVVTITSLCSTNFQLIIQRLVYSPDMFHRGAKPRTGIIQE